MGRQMNIRQVTRKYSNAARLNAAIKETNRKHQQRPQQEQESHVAGNSRYHRSESAPMKCDTNLPDGLKLFYGVFDFFNKAERSCWEWMWKNSKTWQHPWSCTKTCTNQLADVITSILNTPHLTRDHYHLPQVTIVLVPAKSAVCGINDFGFVSLTFTLIKCFEKLDLQHTTDNSPASVDPYHFAFERTD